jgi:hypothetical protein
MPMMPPLLRHLQGTCDRPVPYCTRAFDQQRNDRKPWRDWYRREPWVFVRRQVLSRQPLSAMCEAEGKVTRIFWNTDGTRYESRTRSTRLPSPIDRTTTLTRTCPSCSIRSCRAAAFDRSIIVPSR